MKNKTVFSFFVIIGLLISPLFVSADIGPKPTMKFNLQFDLQNKTTLISGTQYQCEDKNCKNIKQFNGYGAQYFSCRDDYCESQSYGYAPYQKLVLIFSDKTRESQIFYNDSFNAEFDVKVTDSQLIIDEITPINSRGRFPSFIKALIITLIIELLTMLIYVSTLKISKKPLLYVLIANIISLPFVWFLFPSIKIAPLVFLMFVISEIFAVVSEAQIIHYFNKQIITLKRSYILSLIMNCLSLFIGGYIFMFGF